MTLVDIDGDAALGKVRTFIALLEQNHAQWGAAGSGLVVGDPSAASVKKETTAQINEQLPLIKRIAARVDPHLVPKMEPRHGTYSWSYHSTQEASLQLAGLLSSLDEEQRILGPRGPQLAATNLHPWIWNSAVSLWDHGHRREAIQAAAQALFDRHLPEKLWVVPPKAAKDLPGQAFATEPPTPGKPRLRLSDYPEGSPSWISQHQGLYWSWDTQTSTWESVVLIGIGSAFLLCVPLAILTYIIQARLDRVSESQDQISARQEETASGVARLAEEVAQAQADLRLTRDQLSEVARERITANKSKDSALFKAVGEAPSRADVLSSLVRAKEIGVIPDQGCRVSFISDCYLRFTPDWTSGDPVVYESEDPDTIALTLEQADATVLRLMRWNAGMHASEVIVDIAEALQASGVYPGDASFDADKIFADLSALLTLGYDSITRGAVDPVRHIIQLCPPQWAVCDDGIHSTQTPYMIRADKIYRGDRYSAHMSEKSWVDMNSFEEASAACYALFGAGSLAVKPRGFSDLPF
jgi:hypothetical protein